MVMPGIVLAIGLAFIHGFASRIPIGKFIPKKSWLSFSSGVSLGYVFLEIFPELSHAQEELIHSETPFLEYLENHIYILALLGLVIFYILEKMALSASANPNGDGSLFFWIHIFSFALLNGILGYLLQDLARHSLFSCIILFVALALHLFIIDESLCEHHRVPYDRIGRWVLVAAVIVGMALGQGMYLEEATVSIVWAFLAGSIILNVLKRELPSEQDTCIASFVVGVTTFSVLLNLR